ncbi:MAG: signal recognition particle protein [Candidatus Neomarinimicrobiota bacterium]|tara:strand:- start:391 stop:1722 length:1332 start_codon:yes stop_codon:yes gene_type:complete
MFGKITDKFDSILRTIRGVGVINDANINESVREIRRALIDADVNFKVVKKFINNIKEKAQGVKVLKSIKPGEQFVKIIRDELVLLLGGKSESLNLNNSPTIILLAGLQGAGKTTTVGKIANWLKKDKKTSLLVAADVYRPGAIDQLNTIGKSIGVEVYTENIKNPILICKNAINKSLSTDIDTIIIDTAGRLHIDEKMMLEIKEISRVTKPDEILYVADGMTGQDAISSAESFNEVLDITGVILTKMDGDSRGGAAVSIREVTGKPIKFIGTSEKVEGLELFNPQQIADRILGFGDIISLVDKAQSIFDEKSAKQLEKKIKENSFTLEDYKSQLQQIKKMGPISDLIGMIPGSSNKMLKNLKIDNRNFIWTEAIINSMTKREKESPNILNGSRRMRIARGSGRPVHEVNALLNQFSQMQKMMKKMGNFKNNKLPSLNNLFRMR